MIAKRRGFRAKNALRQTHLKKEGCCLSAGTEENILVTGYKEDKIDVAKNGDR